MAERPLPFYRQKAVVPEPSTIALVLLGMVDGDHDATPRVIARSDKHLQWITVGLVPSSADFFIAVSCTYWWSASTVSDCGAETSDLRLADE